MTTKIHLPDIGIDKVEVTEILVKIGDKVEIEQSLMTVEGDKASMEIPSPKNGIVKEIKVSVGETVETGKLIMIFSSFEDENKKRDLFIQGKKKEEDLNTTFKTGLKNNFEFIKNDCYVHATPLIRRIAHEFNIDLNKVKGTGRKGRILREDIKNYIKKTINQAEFSSRERMNFSIENLFSRPTIDFSKFGEIEKIELGRIQKISGANLSRNWIMIPHVTLFEEVDITELEAFRKQQNIEVDKNKLDGKITPISFIMKAVSVALKQMPRFNSSLSEDGQYLILKKYINIGIAVDTPIGLVVPVIKDVNKKSILELSRDLIFFAKKARDGKLTTSEMQGGCFTISSIGNLGTTYFSPIINAPEVAILGVSKSFMKPIWNGKEFKPRLILPISLSFDHSVIDGADGARFIGIIRNILGDIRYLVM